MPYAADQLVLVHTHPVFNSTLPALASEQHGQDLEGDPAFPYSTHNYYSGSSHLQQFPYCDYSMPVDYYLPSWPPPSVDHYPGYLISKESVNNATSGSDNEEDDDD